MGSLGMRGDECHGENLTEFVWKGGHVHSIFAPTEFQTHVEACDGHTTNGYIYRTD